MQVKLLNGQQVEIVGMSLLDDCVMVINYACFNLCHFQFIRQKLTKQIVEKYVKSVDPINQLRRLDDPDFLPIPGFRRDFVRCIHRNYKENKTATNLVKYYMVKYDLH
jgi:hypothetical protein